MFRRLLVSLLVISLVGAVAGNGVLAHFTDTEMGEALFQADNEDLEVDVDGVWYNGIAFPLFGTMSDIKPSVAGGEKTVSLHVYSVAADLYIYLTNIVNDENGTREPEKAAGDAEDNPADLMDGELASFLYLELWEDNGLDGVPATGDTGEGDNLRQLEEAVVWSGYLSELVTKAQQQEPYNCCLVVDTPIVLQACHTYYIGAWWAFDQKVTTPLGPLDVNKAMSDVFSCNVAFFTIETGVPPPPCPPP